MQRKQHHPTGDKHNSNETRRLLVCLCHPAAHPLPSVMLCFHISQESM